MRRRRRSTGCEVNSTRQEAALGRGGAESAVYDCRVRRGLFALSRAMRPRWSSLIRRASVSEERNWCDAGRAGRGRRRSQRRAVDPSPPTGAPSSRCFDGPLADYRRRRAAAEINGAAGIEREQCASARLIAFADALYFPERESSTDRTERRRENLPALHVKYAVTGNDERTNRKYMSAYISSWNCNIAAIVIRDQITL